MLGVKRPALFVCLFVCLFVFALTALNGEGRLVLRPGACTKHTDEKRIIDSQRG